MASLMPCCTQQILRPSLMPRKSIEYCAQWAPGRCTAFDRQRPPSRHAHALDQQLGGALAQPLSLWRKHLPNDVPRSARLCKRALLESVSTSSLSQPAV